MIADSMIVLSTGTKKYRVSAEDAQRITQALLHGPGLVEVVLDGERTLLAVDHVVGLTRMPTLDAEAVEVDRALVSIASNVGGPS